MKILVAGDFHSDIYEKALADAFSSLGHVVERFGWHAYFGSSLWGKFQNKFLFGPRIHKMNVDLLRKAHSCTPDLVFIYRGTHVTARTVRSLCKTGALVFGYNNDDPFSASYPRYFWRHFLASIPHYHHVFAYRTSNIQSYYACGAHSSSLLRSYYIASRNFSTEPDPRYACDVIFIGHFENDNRDACIAALLDARVDFKLYGTEWHRSKLYPILKKRFGEIVPLRGGEYNKALNSARIGLVFLSHLNNDTYTRRCFEIPAAKTFMLSEYTEDLNELFEEGKEAEYFRNTEELIKKVHYYLAHPDERVVIAQAGHARLLRDGHEVTDRAREILRVFEQLRFARP